MLNAKVIRVSCCGANEQLDASAVTEFLKNNADVEIGIGVSREKCSFGMPRFNWILDLQDMLSKQNLVSKLVFHVNGDWSKEIVETGKLPDELLYILSHNRGISRIQLNITGSGHSFENVNEHKLAKLITLLNKKKMGKFIIPANNQSMNYIQKLRSLTKNFDILYDASFGFAKKAPEYFSYFPDQLQGYAGGLSGDNIQEELLKIDNVQKTNVNIWVDAEGMLRKENCNTLDLNKAKEFADNAILMNNKEKSINF